MSEFTKTTNRGDILETAPPQGEEISFLPFIYDSRGSRLSEGPSLDRKEEPGLIAKLVSRFMGEGSLDLLLDQKNGLPASRKSKIEAGNISFDQPPSEKQKWTIVMTHSVEFPDRGEFGYMGGESSINKMASLRELTRNKPVTIVLQTVEQRHPEFQKLHPNLYTYVVKDGEIRQYPQLVSQGYAQDLQNLLQLANRQFPAERISLSLNAHGGGNIGLSAPELVSLEALNDAIKNGLSGSGHDKLDMLRLVACLMGQTGVLTKTQSVARTLIASPEIAYADPELNTQWVTEILADPAQATESLNRKIIEKTRENEESYKSPTLTAYNLGESEELDNALNRLGYALSSVIEAPENLKLISEAIRQTPKFGQIPEPSPEIQKRDLGAFLERLSELAESGALKDGSALREPIRELKIKLEKSILAKQIDPVYAKERSANLSGLSVNLPDFLELERIVKKHALGEELDSLCYEEQSFLLSAISAGRLSHVLPTLSKWNGILKVPNVDKNFAEAASAIKDYASSGIFTTGDELQDRKQKLCSSVDKLIKNTKYDQFRNDAISFARREMIKSTNGAELDPGWNAFVFKLALKQLF